MADVYRMPVPSVPSDRDLDRLDAQADLVAGAVAMSAEFRQVVRAQRHVIRALRVKLAKVEAERDSIKAIADIARDERVAADIPASCPGVGLPPEEFEYLDKDLRLAEAGGVARPVRGRCP